MCDSDAATPSLPTELVTRILQLVSQQEKQRAVRVCSSWKAASLAATSALALPECSRDKFDSFLPWLSKHQQSLNHLTSLHLQLDGWTAFDVPELPCRHLRELQLCAIINYEYGDLPPRTLRSASTQACAGTLTKLVVEGFDLSSQDATSLGQLTALQELYLIDCQTVSAAALLALPSLKSLSLQSSRFSSAAFLPTFFAQQQQLTHLRFDMEDDNQEVEEHLDWQCKLASSLTASSSTLQHLDLQGLYLSHRTWPHMFPEGRTLTHLLYFRLPALRDLGDKLSAADVDALACCCPGLQALESEWRQVLLQPALSALSALTSLQAAVPSVAPAAAVQVVTTLHRLEWLSLLKLPLDSLEGAAALVPLLRCSRLTSLACAGATMPLEVAHDAFATTLAQLTALVGLDVSRTPLRETQLLSLASLVQLTRLRFSRLGFSAAFAQRTARAIGWREGWETIVHEIKATHRDGAPPDVWKPLHRCFAAHYRQLQDDLSASTMLVGLQQQETRQLRQQVQQLQQERQQHTQQLATQQQQIQQHATTMSDRDVVVAELQLEVARLRRQLQQAAGQQQQQPVAAAAPVLGPLAAPQQQEQP